MRFVPRLRESVPNWRAGWSAGLLLLASPGQAAALTLSTSDGLGLSLSDADGRIERLEIDGEPVPLLVGEAGGLSVLVGAPGNPSTPLALSFETDGGPWVSADNADWDGAGDFVTWFSDGGVDDSGHLLLGNGASTGVGMALTDLIPIRGGATLTVAYQARSATTDTLQIIGVRIFDAEGVDITSSATRPSGWTFSSVSQAHVVFGIANSAPDTWEPFTFTYRVPEGAVTALVSIRHWNGGDHLVHLDDLRLGLSGGILWGEPEPLVAVPVSDGQTVTLSGVLASGSLAVSATLRPSGEALAMRFALQSVPASHPDQAVRLRWTLPANLEGWTWWDDLGDSEVLAGDLVVSHTFALAQHGISWYPLSAVASGEVGLSLAVPMDEAVVQRFEASAAGGLSSVWHIGLSPLTAHLGPGHAEVSLLLHRHDGAWGFRSALERHQQRFTEHFAKRTTREGAWEYPIPVTAIASPEDFGFAHFEHWELNWQLQPHEREALRQADVASHFYVEPFVVWDSWFDGSEQPSEETLLERVETWADNPGHFAEWLPTGGLGDGGHLALGDGYLTGTGMATAQRYPISPSQTLTLRWQARVADTATTQIIGVRLYDAAGVDITSVTPGPAGWGFTTASRAHVVAGLVNTVASTWEPFARTYVVPAGAAEARFSLRHWIGGDHVVHIDDFVVEVSGEPVPLLAWDFEEETADWTQARNAEWDTGEATWILAPRQEMAQAVLQSAPRTAAGGLAMMEHSGLWRPNDAGTGGSQLWQLNLDPDLPDPSGFSVFHDHWITPSLASDDGIYVDSTTVKSGFGEWLNHEPTHLAVVDHPLTFDWRDGRAAQIGFQSHAEFFQATTPPLRAQSHLVMANVFPAAHRFVGPWVDLMGSEVLDFTEPQGRSRVRRALAGTRIVSNLLQRFMLDEYATHEQMAEFFRSHLFWGFHPAVSSIGKTVGGRPDRYFLHPELYERDRDLFQRHMPIIRALGEAGWEPITHARAAGAEIERFGDFTRGEIFFTVRSATGDALAATLRADLEALGLDLDLTVVSVHDLLADESVGWTTADAGRTVEWAVNLAPGEVGVFRVSGMTGSAVAVQ